MNQWIVDLPPEKYPILFEFLHHTTGAVVHTITVRQPPNGERAAVTIPPLASLLGHPVRLKITHGDGTVRET